MIHLEGMGVVGSIIAHELSELGLDFTWNDIESPHVAWGASCPTIRPGSDTWAAWLGWVRTDPWWQHFAHEARFFFTTKRPPEGARIGWSAVGEDPWKVADGPAVIIDAQGLVPVSRAEHADRRHEAGPRPGDLTIVTHGFNDRLTHYLWGWSAVAKLDWPGGPAALDHRVGKFVSAYAVPLRHLPGWHRIGAAGGTGLRRQATPKICDVDREVRRWAETMAPLGVSLTEIGARVQGWRPAQQGGSDALALRSGQRITMRPMSHSGFALAPRYVEAVKELL